MNFGRKEIVMSNKDLNKKKAGSYQLRVFGFFAIAALMVMTVYEYPSLHLRGLS